MSEDVDPLTPHVEEMVPFFVERNALEGKLILHQIVARWSEFPHLHTPHFSIEQ